MMALRHKYIWINAKIKIIKLLLCEISIEKFSEDLQIKSFVEPKIVREIDNIDQIIYKRAFYLFKKIIIL